MISNLQYQRQIENRISEYPYGAAFTAADFQDIAETNPVNQALFRIEKEGKIRRVLKGVYDKPAYSELIQEFGVPRIEFIAEALARKFNWIISPSGDTALNLLHISTQVPYVWEFVSDGPYREYQIGSIPLKFRHVMPREIMVIQGLRAIGKGNLTDEQAAGFARILSAENRKIILSESRTASSWIYREIKNICGRDVA